MLNNDWKNLADNVNEFGARASWSSDIGNQLTLYSLILWPCLMLSGFGYSYYLFRSGNYVLASVVTVLTFVSLINFGKLLEIIFNILIFGFVGGVAMIVLFIIGCIGYSIIYAINESVDSKQLEEESVVTQDVNTDDEDSTSSE